MRTSDAPEGLDAKSYATRMIQLLNDGAEGKELDGMVLTHITRYICRLSPAERSDLENQFMQKLQRVCLFTDLNDASQAAALSALSNRKIGEPDPLPFYIDAICRKSPNVWRPNEVRVMQNRMCQPPSIPVRLDTLSILPGNVTLEPHFIVFLNGGQRVEPRDRRIGMTAWLFQFSPPREIDTVIMQNGRGMRGVRIEGRLKRQVACNVTIEHDELIAIVALGGSSTQEGYRPPVSSPAPRISAACMSLIILVVVIVVCYVMLK